MTLRTLTIAGAVLLMVGAPLAACGKLGALEKPSALAGTNQTGNPQAQGQKKGASQEPARPMDTVDTRDAALPPGPVRTDQIPASGLNPDASEPQGALPCPFANPR